MRGLVTKNTGSGYWVRLDNGKTLLCKVKGNFRLKGIRTTNPVAVGDYVEVEEVGVDVAYIKEIEERKNYIIRKASNLSKESHILASNLSQTLLVVTIAHPQTNLVFIDRFLATAEAYRVPAILVFNKIDLYNEEEQELLDAVINLYETIGYKCLKVSATTGEGIEALRGELEGETTLLSGNSGVGKSSIINAIIPDANLRTGNISSSHGTGMHTTTFSEMFDLPTSGAVIDTPGIKGFGTIDFKEAEVSHYFPEIFKESADCRFGNCTHRNEPGCAVLKALEEQRISQSRYASYLSILEDITDGKYRTGL
ncbi:MAG: ribosome small subunit-dependent GTPase A [Bacteroidales bacterium]|nr:ribosome small subunit-dependent GTPase A [Bacteroidales bacterium]MBR3608738.1 ribosome small subunit-dependent GTPase A [Bacteroidales bacterium]